MGVIEETAGDNMADAPMKESAGVKYRLVEAEEVGTSHKQGKLNWASVPVDDEDEAPIARKTSEVEGGEVPVSAQQHKEQQEQAPPVEEYRGHAHRGRGRGGRFNGRSGRRNSAYYDNNGAYYNGVYVPNPDVTVTAQWARSQIEFYFSPENLVHDIFLRQHMDVDGYVPLAFVGSFQAVYSLHQDYASLLDAMKQSEYVELDEVNEKVRLRDNWAQWLWPNAEGGYGVPRYIKIQEEDATPVQ